MDEPSQALLVPSNRFELLECRAALEAVARGRTGHRRRPHRRARRSRANMCSASPARTGLMPTRSMRRSVPASPYAGLMRADFNAVVNFVATGGYALRSYERFAKLRQDKAGHWRASNARVIQQYRMNVGTIVESTMLKVRLGRARGGKPGQPSMITRGGRVLGEVEEYFAETMTPGDTFIFAGEVLRFEGITGNEAVCSRAAPGTDPKIPSYNGGKFPLSTFLAARVRTILANPKEWASLPEEVSSWLHAQRLKSRLPKPGELLVETFPRGGKFYLVGLSVRGSPRPPDARHAADAAAGARQNAAARLRLQ